MRQAAQAGRISALFVYQPDRLSSDLGQLAMLMEELRGHGVKVRFAEGSKYSGLEAFTVGILEYVSQMERADAAERSMRARIRLARSGILPVGINPGLFGYDYDKVRKVRTVNETEAGAVRLMFEWASEGVTTYRIAKRLNARGIRTKRGCCWTQLAVRRIFMSCAFTGVQCYGKDGYRGTAGKKRAAILRPDSEVIRVVGFSPRSSVRNSTIRSRSASRRGGSRQRNCVGNAWLEGFHSAGNEAPGPGEPVCNSTGTVTADAVLRVRIPSGVRWQL